ncbi:hypothetical protein BDF22DRAFT_9116 [Syncephalis plumigaleata]|nr:hypothetical protein BDF22DRAFT_9116 [Syncephalis plumigaleata]
MTIAILTAILMMMLIAKSMPTWLREANPVKEYSLSTEKMRQLARQCNYGKDRAKKAQDASSMLYLALYLDRLVGQTTRGLLRKDAIILEVLDRSVRVSIMEYDIEQRVYLNGYHYIDPFGMKRVKLKHYGGNPMQSLHHNTSNQY